VTATGPAAEHRALVLAPYGRDAALAGSVLGAAGLAAEACADPDALCRELARGAGLAVVTEEALATADLHGLSAWLTAQPPWSDFPFVLLTRRVLGIERNPAAVRLTSLLGNVSLVERPFHPSTLASAAAVALRARQRQYQARDHLREREAAAERQLLLLAELNHRVKNMLAVIQSIAKQTASRAGSTPTFVAAFRGRLEALAAAHNLLTATGWEGVGLDDLARTTLAPHFGRAGDRLQLELADVPLSPALAQSLALVFHELATNATKHGALASPEGTVRLVGEISARELRLLWHESGGPPVERPTARGFGTTLVERALAHQHGGRVELDWRRDGLVCHMRLPLERATSG
jgi:two-component sensor histidine kinase